MKVLILTVSTGYGHHATANAAAEALRSRGASVEIVDIYEKINRLFKEGLSRGYVMTMKYMKGGYRIAYRYMERRPPVPSEYSFSNLVNALLGMKFSAFIYDIKPDAIICTHPFAAQLLNELKRRGLAVPVVGIVTDYTLPPLWADVSFVDYIVTPSEVFNLRCEGRGIAPGRILPFGIPVLRKFLKKLPKDEARIKLGLAPDLPTALIMSGSMGFGNISAIVRRIHATHRDLQLMVVCGTNRHHYEKLKPLDSPKLRVYAFVDNIDEMMDAADCIVTKPGGLTVSESFAKELPMVLLSPIPGHEERNVEFLLNCGIALQSSKTFPIDEAVYHLFKVPGRLPAMVECIRLYNKPRAAEDIADFIMSLGERTGGLVITDGHRTKGRPDS